MNTEDFNYDLPLSYIAQKPIEPRDNSKLLVFDRSLNYICHRTFKQLGEFLQKGDLLVINQTRVIPARIFARKMPGGGRVEILLLRKIDDLKWLCLVGGSGLVPGRQLVIENGPGAHVTAVLDGAQRVICFENPIETFFDRVGHVPLPPYIHEKLQDPARYQTVYAAAPGSAAAPTAGLHFTPQLIQDLEAQGISFAEVTLHVGLDTFAPVTETDPEEHVIHKEWCELTCEVAERINLTREQGGRVVAVGTTTVRTLESSADPSRKGYVLPWSGDTGLYILPGYQFKVVDAMTTNFHLPKSTLLMLVSAFTGRERILELYELAKQENYRFFSFGDAMLIL